MTEPNLDRVSAGTEVKTEEIMPIYPSRICEWASRFELAVGSAVEPVVIVCPRRKPLSNGFDDNKLHALGKYHP